MFRFAVFVVSCICASTMATPYGAALAPGYGGGIAHAPAPAAQVVHLPSNAEAQAAALTNAAGAKASAAKINAVQWKAVNDYGWQIGVPLLAKSYGPLTSLYAASLPPRSFVGEIDPAFLKKPYGQIKFVGETSIGAVAI